MNNIRDLDILREAFNDDEQPVRLSQSDSMICNSKAFATFKNKKQSDLSFYYSIDNKVDSPLPYTNDSAFMIPQDTRMCVMTNGIMMRGGNGYSCLPDKMSCFTRDTSAFLLDPCPENTFQNHIVCDDDKCCSLRHQMFNNITKRNGVVLQH